MAPATAQLEFASLGIDALPAGVSNLTRREMAFVAAYLRHGQMRQAAIEAGYSEESAAQIASETLRKPKVQAFWARCIDQLAGESRIALRACAQRHAIFQAKFLEATQNKADAEAWLVKAFHRENGKNAKEVMEYELARERAQRDEKHYANQVRQEATLLLRALGKITDPSPVTVNVVSPEVRAHLAELEAAGVRTSLPEIPGLSGGRC